MSIFFDFDVGPSGRRLRRAVDEDKYDIEKFCDRNLTVPLFGEASIGALIELSTLSICMINERKEVTGFVALGDHPVQAALHAAHWEIWMRNMFHRFYLSRNTLFIHYMCCAAEVVDYFVSEALVSVFVNDLYLKNILLLVNKGCPEECYTKYNVFQNNITYTYNARRFTDDNLGMIMFAAEKRNFCPQLKLRRAVQEDNDEIVEILDKKCPRLKELYGEYYIAELVGHHPETKRRIIVAEQKDRSIAGVMCLNSDINYEKLQGTYDLKQFYGLMKTTPLDREMRKRSNKLLSTFGEPVMCGKWSPYSRMVKMKTVRHPSFSEQKTMEIVKAKSSRVSFDQQVYRSSIDSRKSSDASSKYAVTPTTSVQSQMTHTTVVALLEEDDPFEYEIVNIDAGLMMLPDELPFDELLYPDESEMRTTTLTGNNETANEIGPDTEITMSRKVDKRTEKQTTKRRTSLWRKENNIGKVPEVPKRKPSIIPFHYVGEPNAFVIELFGLRDDVHERHSFDLLEAAFEIMKDYDYCIIEVPLEEPAFSLLQHFCFVPILGDIHADTALYVAHRNAIFGKLRVREAEMADVPQISQVLHDVEARDTIWTVEDTLMRGKENKVYVMLCGTAVVGFGIVEPPEQIDFIRTKFLLESYHIHKYHKQHQELDSGFTTLKTVVSYRVFEQHFRFFARDMMRLFGSNSLIWLTAYRNKWIANKANILASMMIPLMPRKNEIEYFETRELKRIGALNKSIIPFTTWFLSKKFCSVPMSNVNARIVVVGASRTALAFIDELIFSESCTYLSFCNVTLISPSAVPHIRKNSQASELMFTKYNSSSDNYVKSVPYTYYVNIVHATLVGIDKRHKYVTVSSGGNIYYDYLCLTFGKQYQPPDYFLDAFKKDHRQRHGEPCKYQRLDNPRYVTEEVHITADYLPENVFIVNSYNESTRAINYVTKLASSAQASCTYLSDYKIIVYGATIHTYCCLTALLEADIPAENIIFVEPFPSKDETEPRISLFCNESVDQAVQEVLANLNITVYRSYYYQDWTIDVNNRVTQVQFLSYFKKINLQCSAFFYYGKTGINPQAFMAIHKTGIAYNDGILIDHEFRTKNPYVYAAGPATRYYGKYFADDKSHQYYDSYEIGAKFGEIIRNKLDPLFKPKEKKRKHSVPQKKNSEGGSFSSNRQSLDEEPSISCDIPTLKKPLVTCCVLPGGLRYLHVRPPGNKLPHYYVHKLQYNGYVLETFKRGYFKLHLDMNLVVDGITCLSPVYSLENFKNLYGKPSNVLNNVYLKYVTKRIDDFYDYFRQAWAQFLYIDHVDDLFAMVKELNPKVLEIQSQEELKAVKPIKKRTVPLSTIIETEGLPRRRLPSVKSHIMDKVRPDLEKYQKSSQMDAIIDYVFEWIDQHDILLPMYLHPSKKPLFMCDLNFHPSFRKKKTKLSKIMKMIMS
ncbi:cilia- and flagella-associated protein 61-like isoform X2 [Plodia interpunctella]|uniref:cilia- and flagella-associated protein 61-like isoform X2 n=1 Tax=Plodia interpunctella TaxID=58824 RepID=UPI002367FCD8|nr:cilia- and flagella-associated protein 61-like isoform X2 [Plodia interpunctella]